MSLSPYEKSASAQHISDEQELLALPPRTLQPELRRQIIEQSSDCIKLLDLNGHLLYMNRGGQQVMEIDDFSTCYSADWLSFWSGANLKLASNALATARNGGTATFEGEALTAKGTPKWWEVTVTPVLDAQDRLSHLLSISRDITERKRSQIALAEQARLGRLSLAISTALTQGTTLHAMLNGCTQALFKHLDAAFARIWILNEEQDILELQASSGLYTHLDGGHARIPMGAFKIGRIAQQREPILTNNVLEDEHIHEKEWAAREGMVAFAGYPLLIADRLIGVMALFARHPLSPSTLEAMATVANSIAVGIDRHQGEQARLHLLQMEQQARQAAEHAQQRVTTILESIGDAFFALDLHWNFTYLNAQSEILLQRQQSDLLGKSIWDEFPQAIGSLFYEQYHLAVNQQVSVSFEEFFAPLNCWFEVRAYPSSEGLSVYYHDINERKEIERERERLLELEQQKHNEAEVTIAVRNTFLSSVSHDLKTPLAAIKANLQLVQRRMRREPSENSNWITERLGAMERALTKMTGMIDDLLALSQLRASQPVVDGFMPLDLVPLLQAVVTEQQATTRRHNLLLTIDSKSLPISGNATRLDRMVTNLLGNAIKYSPDGGDISIEVTREQHDEQTWARIVLADQGIGIPAADLSHIFTPFQRASNVTDHIQGTGIGLASVAQVIEQHQGTIMVTSQEGQGSQFTILLPLLLEEQG
ncbi:hypothetical protein KDW_53400 [Dictyobacter vulcani]|uniref:histidine kinase n=1 Tax=Dictyobacter vulcani TaxID=2607529 RepID=A0A5J4KNB3_9CHLR|nr:ATP-binding protein [Dictyobacter vulcani]GER91178.1 hypothetical protein KDW_53400 [Dictyobacter vulcani]